MYKMSNGNLNIKNKRGNWNMKQKSENLVNNKDLYQFQVGNINVEFKYSENDKKINECMINILKQKSKLGWFFKLNTLHYKRREVK